MGKKRNKKELPFVSVCTPTFNRRPFIEYTIKCYMHQDYPKDKMEWIIIDDGTDKIEDLVIDISGVKYYKYDNKMSLGKKRNLMHEKSRGDFIVYMDDDDYYPPERVSHAVNMLQTHNSALCAGSSEIYIYFKHIDKMYQFGPYGANHATAGTFAFKRKLLENHRYNDSAALAEEKEFLKNYTVPFVQLEPKKTILVFSHIHNTFDKKKLLEQPDNQCQKPSDKTVDDFIKNEDMKNFYMNTIEKLLINYEPGDPKMKPDVLEQIKEIDIKRNAMNMKTNQNNNQYISINQNGKNIALDNNQVVEILHGMQSRILELSKIIQEREATIQTLNEQIDTQKKIEASYVDNLKKLFQTIVEKDLEINNLTNNSNK